MRAGVGQSEASECAAALAEACDQAATHLGGHPPGAAVIFTHVDADHQALAQAFATRYPDTPMIGCSTAGEYSTAGGFSEDSVIVALVQSDRARFAAGLGRNASDTPAEAARTALADARDALGDEPRVCLFLPDSRSAATGTVLEALDEALPAGCPVFGGAAARVGTSEHAPAQLFGGEAVNDGVPVLLIGGDVECAFSVCNSWQPVGEPTTAEGADGNAVGRIGGRSALEFYQHYLGPHAKPAAEFPLAVHDEKADRHYMRVPIGYDEDTGSISFGAAVPEGASVQLSEATPGRILEETDRSAAEVADAFSGPPALALAFSCNARKGILGTQSAEEPEKLSVHIGGDVATAGFFGFAEISPLRVGRARPKLHHGTLVTVLLGDGVAPSAATSSDGTAPTNTTETADILKRKLERSEYYRKDLEQIRDVNAALLRTVGKEIEEARDAIARQKAELEELHASLEKEQAKSERLLRNILPGEVAEELKDRGVVEPVHFESASVLFTDFVGFTTRATALSPADLVSTLNDYFTAFDEIVARHGIEKLKTIGDAYMCVAGVPHPRVSHVEDMVRAALEMQAHMETMPWELRIGIHAGPLMAGVIGSTKFAYDVWGDTVNIAARLESAGAAGRVNVSQAVHDALGDAFRFEPRGKIAAKNVGEIDMYFVEAA